MKRYEYRLSELRLKKKTDGGAQLLSFLNAAGNDGWRACNVEGDKEIRVLFEREIEGEPQEQ